MTDRLWSRLTGSLRHRLLALTLFPLLLVLPGVIVLAYLWSNEVGYRQLLMKANTDLAVAHEAFSATRTQYMTRLTLAAGGYRFRDELMRLSRPSTLAQVDEKSDAVLEQLRKETGFDFVRLLDTRGCIPGRPGGICGYPASPLIRQALTQGTVSGVEVFSARQLRMLDESLAQRSRIPLVPTEHSGASAKTVEDRGMVLHFVHPLRNNEGKVVALLAAGLLMNGNLAFVDHISDTVYGPGSLPVNGIGTVTLFLDDVRITTNVQRADAPRQRALGTRVSEQVREQVLERGQRWLDRAFVVSDWYISAYEPVTDVNGKRVGMLYAGFLESPFLDSFYRWLEILLWLFALVLILCIGIAIRGARSIAKPFEVMTSVVNRIREGERRRIPALNTADEIRRLGEHFNAMLDQLDRQHDTIQRAADQLEDKVEERTRELRTRTRELQRHIQLLNRTREQLIEKGKLAALGELTASIAHEVNNPTAVILGYMDLLMDELGEQVTPEIRQDADLIIEQVGRIRTIINDLLKLARSESPAAHLQAVNVNEVIRNTRTLVQHELSRRHIRLTLELHATHPAQADPAQLQQVLINLIMNGANAITDEGEIIIRSRNRRDGGVWLSVRDNGCGIPPAYLPRIFDPFFSPTRGGTGLGLSISYRLLMQADAEIDVRSREGRGSVFVIRLKAFAAARPTQAGHFDPDTLTIGSF